MATMKDYYEDLRDFCARNGKYECKVYTSPLIKNSYHKEFCYSNGATFYEISDVVVEQVEVEVHGVRVLVEVKLRRLEYWSTTNSKSKFVYERFE